MNFTCLKTDLLTATGMVTKAVPAKTTMPILSSILMTVTDKITMTGNDLEMGIETVVEGTVEEPGIVALDAKMLSGIVSKMPDAEIQIKTDGDAVILKSGKSRFKLSYRDGEDFPAVSGLESGASVTVGQGEFKTAISQVIFSVAQNDANKVMRGVLIRIDGEDMEMVALDGHRVAIRHLQLADMHDKAEMIVPGKNLGELAKILSDNGDVEVKFSDTHAMFAFDNTVLVTRLIDGTYFDIAKLMNDDFQTEVTADRKELIECLDRSMILLGVTDKKPVKVTIADNTLSTEIVTNLGSMSESINAILSGSDITIGFNPRLVMDALKAVEDDEVKILMTNPKSPCYIKGDGYNYIVLPVNMA